MTQRVYNFSAGPAVLPEEVLLEARESLYTYKDTGIGILEMSHRSPSYEAIIDEAIANMKTLLGIGDDFEVLFLQGGASLQFHMLPLNLAKGKATDYICTGVWSEKAIVEAKRLGPVYEIASSKDKNYSYLPKTFESQVHKDSAYLHFTSNNTIFGTQFKEEPPSNGIPLVCDASSDFLSRPIPMDKYGLLYAGAQKNIGPAGVVVVVMRKELLKRSEAALTPMLSYAVHAKEKSLYNTPPCFSIYVVGLVLKLILKLGGLSAMQKRNEDKAQLLYDYLDRSKMFRGTAEKSSRSLMNVPFRLPSESLEETFIKESSKAGFSGLKGHRSVGGMRASIYNAFPKEGVEALVAFMKAFEATHTT
jgi:phosphoserine aminotransferase